MKKFPAEIDKLYSMLDYVRSYAKQVGFDSGIVNKIELATEEVLVNIINYGYPDSQGTIEIYCSHSENLGIKIVIKDTGIPYNPLKNRKEFNSRLALEERTIGGYGVFFILNLMDEVNYEREQNYNVLTLIKESKPNVISA